MAATSYQGGRLSYGFHLKEVSKLLSERSGKFTRRETLVDRENLRAVCTQRGCSNFSQLNTPGPPLGTAGPVRGLTRGSSNGGGSLGLTARFPTSLPSRMAGIPLGFSVIHKPTAPPPSSHPGPLSSLSSLPQRLGSGLAATPGRSRPRAPSLPASLARPATPLHSTLPLQPYLSSS